MSEKPNFEPKDEDIDLTWGEKPEKTAEAESDYDASDSRRSFLKNLGLGAIGAVGVGVGTKLGIDQAEKNEEIQILNLVNGQTTEVAVPEGFGVDYFYPRSGWHNGRDSVALYYYREAVRRLNPGVDTSKLLVGQRIMVPIREGEVLSQE